MKTKTDTKAQKKLAKIRHKAKIKASRPAHKQLLMHPLAVFIALCIGVLLFGITWHSSAASYDVTAKVSAAPITDPAVITAPAEGTHFTTKPVDVIGTCYYQSYIKLTRNGTFSGVAICQPDGTFSLKTDLNAGANKLEAHIFNTTDDEGPLGVAVNVFYDPPALPVETGTTSGTGPAPSAPAVKAPPFVITSDYKYIGHKPGEQINWTIGISGGHPPYAFNVKWGDGSDENYPTNNTESLNLSHKYTKEGEYVIRVQATDVDGQTASLQLATIINAYKNTIITGSLNRIPQAAKNGQSWLWLAWPAYATFSLMLVSFWLGEKLQFIRLNKTHNRRR